MRMTTLARRYAGALFGAAKDAGVIDRVESDLGLLTYSLQTMPNLREAITHPLLPGDKKKKIVADVFNDKIEPITREFIDLVIDKRRVEVLDDAEQEYIRLANEFRNITPIMVTSAVPLTTAEQNLLRTKLERFTGKTVTLTMEQDPDLIGGVVIRIGDTIIDGSIKGRLAALRNKLLGKD